MLKGQHILNVPDMHGRAALYAKTIRHTHIHMNSDFFGCNPIQ